VISIKHLFVELKQATEGRVVAFSHDITPDMLRTKPDPDVEQRQNQFEQRALQVRMLLTEIIT
jgi:mediator of RNA polymerase II transcription subunit 8